MTIDRPRAARSRLAACTATAFALVLCACAQATLKQAEAESERQADLASRQVASKQALDNATANRDSARARLKQAEVDTAQAELNLGYTQVKAPFDGTVTARLVSLGELVGANGPTH